MKLIKKIKKWQRSIRALRRYWRKKNTKIYILIFVFVLLIGTIKIYTNTMPIKINPESYKPLLSTIAKGESNGNYNAYFGNSANIEIDFTKMPIKEVQQWQEEYVRSGSPSSAVGKYQIIQSTLDSLVAELSLSGDEMFDGDLQDKMAIALLERRGSLAYMGNQLSSDQFAANIAQEWAALPKIIGENPDKSYYANDGLNKANISIDEVYRALNHLEKS